MCRVSSFLWVGVIALSSSLAYSAEPMERLPRYDLKVKLDTEKRNVEVLQRVTWTNRTERTTKELVFNFYPLYQIPHGDYLLLAKTLEMLRLDPHYGIDRVGGHGTIRDIRIHDRNGGTTRAKYWYREDNPCAMVVELPNGVAAGESVVMDIDCEIKLPKKQGRWGQWDGVSYLTHALPTLAYHDNVGWHAMPFVPWHQPFWNEAGRYYATIEMPADETLACSAQVKSVSTNGDWKTVTCEPFIGRDFAIISSKRFKEFTKITRLDNGREVLVRCLAFQEHEYFAKEMLEIADNALKTYSQWFGPYPYDQFTIAESYFGWNGNECAGLVMIDERVFDMPKAGRGYVEYLLSHEICHQWWYNLIGTNGYSETFMDEGPATYFTHRMLDKMHGQKNNIVQWPRNLRFFPNMRRDTYRYAPMLGAIRRDEMPAAAGQLPEFGNLFNLFTGAYDRGSKFFGMIEARMGETAFFDFIQDLMKKYAFGVISASTLKFELEKYTGKNWDEVFDKWVYGQGMTDWSVDDVDIRPNRAVGPRVQPSEGKGYRVEITVHQRGEYTEATNIGFRFADQKGYPIRIPIGPIESKIDLPEYEGHIVRVSKDEYRVMLTLPDKPVNVVIDPDNVLLDSDPSNNSWNRDPKVNIAPLYSLLTESDLTNDYDRWNINAGPWIWGSSNQDPWYTRSTLLGLRAGATKTQTFNGGLYGAYRWDYRDFVAGIDGLFDHFPLPRTQIGFNVERRIAGPFFGDYGGGGLNRASLFTRYIMNYSSSLYLAPIHFVDAYTSYTDNFLPYAHESGSGSERPVWTWLSGVHYRLNLYTPYWNPEKGVWVDVTYGAGPGKLLDRTTIQSVKGDLAGTYRIPDENGFLTDVRLAGRLAIASAWPSRGDYFALGGGTLYRGFDLSQRQGSAYWVANAEARVPMFSDVKWNFFDNAAGIRNVYGALFYDVGAVYSSGKMVNDVAHALGGGVRVDSSIFSFIERATFRFDVAKTLNANTPVQFWIGLQHPF